MSSKATAKIRSYLFLCIPILSFTLSVPAQADDAPTVVVQGYLRTLSAAKTQEELDKFETKNYSGKQHTLLNGIAPARKAAFTPYLRTGLPKTVKVSSEKINGETAKVDMQAVGNQPMQPAQQSKDPSVELVMQKFGTFFLKREEGQWKIDAECWDSDKSQCPSINPNDWDIWVKEASRIDYPQTPAGGKLEGTAFVPDSCTVGPDQMFGGTWLQFSGHSKSGSKEGIYIDLLDEPANVEGQVFEVGNEKLSWPKKKMFNIIRESDRFPSTTRTSAGAGICCMKLKFEKALGNKIPGSIVLRMRAQPETSIAGTFTATKK